jgi:hypothetical protein
LCRSRKVVVADVSPDLPEDTSDVPPRLRPTEPLVHLVVVAIGVDLPMRWRLDRVEAVA